MSERDWQRLWQRIRRAWPGFWETTSHICITLALLVAFVEYQVKRDKERMDSAWSIYREVDHAYREFMKVCFDHPKLDCYAVPQRDPSSPPLTKDEELQQKVLYDMLTDVVESAFVHFVKFREHLESKEAKRLFRDQWESWDTYIVRFLSRPSYLAVWLDVQDGYDVEFRCHMKDLISKRMNAAADQTLDQSLRAALQNWLSSPKTCPP